MLDVLDECIEVYKQHGGTLYRNSVLAGLVTELMQTVLNKHGQAYKRMYKSPNPAASAPDLEVDATAYAQFKKNVKALATLNANSLTESWRVKFEQESQGKPAPSKGAGRKRELAGERTPKGAKNPRARTDLRESITGARRTATHEP